VPAGLPGAVGRMEREGAAGGPCQATCPVLLAGKRWRFPVLAYDGAVIRRWLADHGPLLHTPQPIPGTARRILPAPRPYVTAVPPVIS
jgi:hypothetical protein